MSYLEQAIKDGYAHITGAEGKRQITYVSSDNHKERYDDPEEKVRAEVWAELIYQQFLQRSSGGNYPAITQDEMKKVVIPIPDREIQDRIVKEAVCRKNTARQLKHEAETEWSAAKERFERELMGN